MAVYKATYCYPFLNTFDGRVTATSENSTPAQYLKCKIESSNKIITGYSIEILDENNNVIFPYNILTHKISPIVELQQNLGKDINSGYNGTYLNIPFFQNNASENRVASADRLPGGSYNAVYYRPKFKAHYLIGTTLEFTGVDNVANWSYDTNTDELYYEGFSGILNEELVSEGELVFVASPSTTYGGVWVIQSSGRLVHYTLPGSPSVEIDTAYLGTEATIHGECFVTVTNGIYHGRVYETNIDDGEVVSFTPTDDVMWKDVSGNLINLSNNAGSYKWVITLYQSPELGSWSGSTFMPDYRKAAVGILKDSNNINIEPANISITHSHPWYCNYANMPIDWYDMSLNRGTILGSTKDRIQVSDYSGKYIPGDGSTEPIVLQGRYLQLFDENDAQLSLRAYINAYDASYGHIYPMSGSFTNDQIGTWSSNDSYITKPLYAKVFEYSNDPDAILASDRVRVATTTDITLSGTQVIDGVTVETGDYVLVKNQISAKNNGVYVVSSDASWSRAGSYNTWGKFIGKVFFIEDGSTNKNTNWVSLARAGGSLYTGSGSSGDSPLNFRPEKPILLFPNLVNKTVSFLWISEPSSTTLNYDVIDGVICQQGDICLCSANGHLYSCGERGQSPRWTDTGIIIGSNQEIVRILYGKSFGETYYSFISGEEGLTNIPVSAFILRNTTTKTYIKPYVGLDNRMALVFNNNQKITYSDSSQKNYLLMTSVDTKLWSINHAELSEALPSWGDSIESNTVPFSYDVKSFYKASDENPFSLYDNPYLKLGTGNGGYTDITTYQPYWVKDTPLDEVASKYFCVFYDNQGDNVVQTDEEHQVQPIIRGTISNDLESFTDTEETVYGADSGQTLPLEDDFFFDSTNEHYYVWDSDSSTFTPIEGTPAWDTSEEEVEVTNIPFYVIKPSVTAFASRYITLQGHYYQWQQASWESYRWILTDLEGNILQDTGKKYDQSMSVTFYGLSNEAAGHKNHYYAILLVEDELGHSLSYAMHIVVDPNSVATVSIPFFAEYDCNTHSVELSYQANSFVKPSILLNEGDKEVLAYVSNNELLADAGLWDDSLMYGWDSVYALTPSANYVPGKYNTYYVSTDENLEAAGITGWVNITGSKNSVGEELQNIVQQRNYLSNTELLGLKYEYYFERRSQTQDASSHQLTILEQEDNGEFSLQTKIKLSDNFCSNIVEAAVDYGDKTHQLHVQLAVPLKFTALDSDELNSNRDKIQLKIFTDQTQVGNEITRYLLKDSEGGSYKWRESVDPSKTCYYLRTEMKDGGIWNEDFATGLSRPVALDKDSEYLHYIRFTHTAESQPDIYFYPFFINIEDNHGDKGVINSTKFLGNSCLVCEDDLALVNAWDPIHYVLSTNDDDTKLNFEQNRNFFLKYAPCYWAENRPRVKLFQKTGMIDNPMNLLYNTDDLTYDEATGALVSWPDETNEDTFYWQEYDQESVGINTTLLRWKNSSPKSWGEIFGKNIPWNAGQKDSIESAKAFVTDCGWKPLTYRPRNYGWLSNASFLITIRVSDIDTLGSASDNDVTVTGEDPSDDYIYTTNIFVSETKVGSVSIQKIRDTELSGSYFEPSY